MEAEQAGTMAVMIAKKLADLLYKEIPNDDRDSGALRQMTLGAFISFVTVKQDDAFYDLLRRTVEHYNGVLEDVAKAYLEHQANCPGKVKH